MQTILVTANFIVSFTSATLLYFALRNRLWREYYRFNKRTPHPRDVDRGDKMTSLMFACALGAVWPISIPAYLTYRYRVMKARRDFAIAYAESRMRQRGWYREGE